MWQCNELLQVRVLVLMSRPRNIECLHCCLIAALLAAFTGTCSCRCQQVTSSPAGWLWGTMGTTCSSS